jgi:hypothetical protein
VLIPSLLLQFPKQCLFFLFSNTFFNFLWMAMEVKHRLPYFFALDHISITCDCITYGFFSPKLLRSILMRTSPCWIHLRFDFLHVTNCHQLGLHVRDLVLFTISPCAPTLFIDIVARTSLSPATTSSTSTTTRCLDRLLSEARTTTSTTCTTTSDYFNNSYDYFRLLQQLVRLFQQLVKLLLV